MSNVGLPESPPEASPAERRRRRVRDTILEAAERVFAEDGEAGLSIRRLADEIDYSPAAIYKYFGSKTELVDELKEAFFERILAEVDRMRELALPFPERARHCVGTYVRKALEKPHHYAAAFSGVQPAEDGHAAPSHQESWDAFLSQKKGQAFVALMEMTKEGVEVGAFRSDLDPALAAKSIWAASHGLALLMAHFPRFPLLLPSDSNIDRDAFIDFHADQIVRGLEK